jgi:hypothetical protein
MKSFSLAIILGLLIDIAAVAQGSVFFAGGNICPTESWKLVFQDEFNGTSLDLTKWARYYPCGPGGNDQCEFSRTHGTELQIYKDNNVSVLNGKLLLPQNRNILHGLRPPGITLLA